MPTTAPAPSLRIHRPPGDESHWPPRANPRRPPTARPAPPRPARRRPDELDWYRYGRLPNGAAPGCYLDLIVHEGRPPSGVDAGWCGAIGKWISARVVDPLAEAVDG